MKYTSIITISVTISRHPDFGNLKNAGNGVPVAEVCRKHGVSSTAFYEWRAKRGGMDAIADCAGERAGKDKRPL